MFRSLTSRKKYILGAGAGFFLVALYALFLRPAPLLTSTLTPHELVRRGPRPLSELMRVTPGTGSPEAAFSKFLRSMLDKNEKDFDSVTTHKTREALEIWTLGTSTPRPLETYSKTIKSFLDGGNYKVRWDDPASDHVLAYFQVPSNVNLGGQVFVLVREKGQWFVADANVVSL